MVVHADLQPGPRTIGSQNRNSEGNRQDQAGPVAQRQASRSGRWGKRGGQSSLLGVERHNLNRGFPNPGQDLNGIMAVRGETSQDLAKIDG